MSRETDPVLTFLHGMITLLGLFMYIVILSLIWQDPVLAELIILGILGGGTVIYSVGWCINHADDFLELLTRKQSTPADPTGFLKKYKNPILDKLDFLERKYAISTLDFMFYVSREFKPDHMDNLDYIEWLSLVNDLPSVRAEESEETING